jgi:hypothetical protein
MSTTEKLRSLAQPPSCPACGTQMRLARIEPAPGAGRRAEQITYDCTCGQLVTKVVETPA